MKKTLGIILTLAAMNANAADLQQLARTNAMLDRCIAIYQVQGNFDKANEVKSSKYVVTDVGVTEYGESMFNRATRAHTPNMRNEPKATILSWCKPYL